MLEDGSAAPLELASGFCGGTSLGYPSLCLWSALSIGGLMEMAWTISPAGVRTAGFPSFWLLCL